jgi:hypothetical protein
MSTFDEVKQYLLVNKTLMHLVEDFPKLIHKSDVDKWKFGFEKEGHCNPNTRVFTAFGLGFTAYYGKYGDSQVKQFGQSLPGGLAEDLLLDALQVHQEDILNTMAHEAANRAHGRHEELCDEAQKYTDLLNQVREMLDELETRNA